MLDTRTVEITVIKIWIKMILILSYSLRRKIIIKKKRKYAMIFFTKMLKETQSSFSTLENVENDTKLKKDDKD